MATLAKATRLWTVTPNAVTVSATGNVLNTNKDILIGLVAQLIARGLATMDYSITSTVAGTKGDGVNRWLARADIVGAAAGVAHSKVVLTLANSLGHILIDREGTFEGSGRVYWSESVGFTGGSTTARPTATDEIEIGLASGNILHTVDGNMAIHMWKCATGVRWAVTNDGASAGPCAVVSIEKAGNTPAAFTSKIVARWMGGSGTFGNRTDWTGQGWKARVSATSRTPLAVGETPPTTNDVDGDVLLAPTGIEDATIGRLGFIDDFHFVKDAFTAYGTLSDAQSSLGWIALDEVVWPWDHTTAMAGNTAGGKLLVNYLPSGDATAPVVTLVSPAAPGSLATSTAPLVFDVTDLAPGLRTVAVHLLFDSAAHGDHMHTVYLRDAFQRGYSGGVVSITNGLRFTVNAPLGGWPGPFTIQVEPVDAAGNITA